MYVLKHFQNKNKFKSIIQFLIDRIKNNFKCFSNKKCNRIKLIILFASYITFPILAFKSNSTYLVLKKIITFLYKVLL